MEKTGLSEDELTRMFMIELIKNGKNPFDGMPKEFLDQAKQNYPDIVDLAKKKFAGV